METIQDLIPKGNAINFYQDTVQLPEGLGSDLKIILGAGDHERDVLDVEKFSMFDVFFCLPEDTGTGSIRGNLEYLQNNEKKQVICYLDAGNPEHVKRFCNLFEGRFSLVDGFGNHTPHLPLDCIAKILKPGGKAVNLYEGTNGLTYRGTKEIEAICQEGYVLEKKDEMFLFGVMKMDLSPYKTCIDTLIVQQLQKSSITIEQSLLNKMDLNEKLRLLGVLVIFPTLPVGLEGKFQENTRIWRQGLMKELVVTKVVQGGKRKRRTRRHKRKSKSRKH